MPAAESINNTVAELKAQSCKAIACALYEKGFTVTEISNAGYKEKNLLPELYKEWSQLAKHDDKRGILAEKIRGDFSATKIKAYSFKLNGMIDIKYEVVHLKDSGYSASALKVAKFSITELKVAGFSIA